MSTTSFQDCIDACNACADACDNCAAMCLGEEDVKAMARCISNDIDCAQLCRTAASLMSRNSVHAAAMCRLCAQACEACATECARHDMAHCQQCAAACKDCAAACAQMAAA
ncbi:four-helix bundle copper-binding protein [Massilia forsythiae]|uniref:Four-helix bundle copper-binding protein n=1 Tax=Massilia forsythiae TaxID=2728020 RepID=A0A7Z2VZS7_9BURK|nr:four-helix bundle copper-binding protein [Massilia forsythiae]QJE02468.1 four-helix bundle copper-binding protein [Massilia forsythiae]